MPLDKEADYSFYLYTCNRCRSCAVDPTLEMRPTCPAYSHFGFFTYSGGGKGYVAQGILEGKVKPSVETAEVAMNCLLCGGCASMCPPGFDTMAFIRDLRDHLVGKGVYINDAHKEMLDKARRSNLWGKSKLPEDAPRFTGSEELLVFLGCRERAKIEVLDDVGTILDAAKVSWGVLDDELCCGAPLEDLGDTAAFEEMAIKNIEALNSSGAERVLIICPHCASTIMNDYFNVDDLEVDVVTLPSLLAELIGDERIDMAGGEQMSVTFHDPCRLSRFIEEDEPPREVLESIEGIELVEMERHGASSWCCGSGAWAAKIVPELAGFTTREKISEARATGADHIITACSYCTQSLQKASRKKQKVEHLAKLVASRLKGK